jgi:PAS domain S-box-containing protein
LHWTHEQLLPAQRRQPAPGAEVGATKGETVTDERAELRGRLAACEAEIAGLRERLATATRARHHTANELTEARNTARDNEARLLDILKRTTDFAIVTTDTEGCITLWSDGAATLFGWDEEAVLGESLERVFTPEDRANGVLGALLAKVQADDRAEDERWLVRKDGSRFFGGALVLPLANGSAAGFLTIFRDRTREHSTELAYLSGEEQLRLILESATDYAIFSMDRDGSVITWNSGAERLLGFTEEEIIGRDARIIFTPEDCAEKAPEHEMATALAEGRATNERWHVRKDGSRFWGSGLMMPLQVGDSQPGLIKIMRDQTERRQHEEMQRLLIGELNHRIKNTLTTVQTLADQTLRGAASLDAFAAAFKSRLQALAQAHDLLTREAWQEVGLADVASAVLEGWVQHDRIAISGPPLRVNPKQALALALSLHELATNAMKHGALSGPAGQVTLAWAADDACRITWTESGGPLVAPPTRRGFGSRILHGALAAELDGSVTVDYRPDGVVCSISFMLKQIAPLPQPPLGD